MESARPKDEKALVRRVRAGDEEACREFFERFRGLAYAIAMGIVGRDADAMDVVQEAFLKAFRSIGRFEGRSSLGTWFRRIVTNAGLDALRARRGKEMFEASEELETMVPPRSRNERSPDDEAQGRELARLVEEAMRGLPEPQRVVLTLVTQAGLSYAQTAQSLGVPVGTVMSRLFYARQALREALRGKGYFEEES
ncbi:MAG: sigma-70 family RNA polymerase sigma factor [Planctomycetota bacterium]